MLISFIWMLNNIWRRLGWMSKVKLDQMGDVHRNHVLNIQRAWKIQKK